MGMQCCCTSRVENGHTVPSIETLAKYAQALGIPQYVYFDNHYEGFVMASVERFRRLCAAKGVDTLLNLRVPAVIEPTLFDISPN